MDGQIRWLRRLLISRVAKRLAMETTVAGVAVFCGAFMAGLAVFVCAILAVAAAQSFALIRAVAAVFINPVNHGYLTGWENTSHRLEVSSEDDGRDKSFDALLDQSGFHPLVNLTEPDGQQIIHVYSSTSRLIVISTAEAGEPFVVLSRLSDDRLLVSASEVVPPRAGMIINQCAGASLPKLVETHVKRLRSLQDAGLQVVEVDHRAVIEQLHLEWDAWHQLGPFIGPFLAVGMRQQPLTLQIRVSPESLWDRTAALPSSVVRPVPEADQPVAATPSLPPTPTTQTAIQSNPIQPNPIQPNPIPSIPAQPKTVVGPSDAAPALVPAWTTRRRPRTRPMSGSFDRPVRPAPAVSASQAEPNPGTPTALSSTPQDRRA